MIFGEINIPQGGGGYMAGAKVSNINQNFLQLPDTFELLNYNLQVA